MPVEIIENTDPLTRMVQFRTSLVYEMIVSLHTLTTGRRHLEWAKQAHVALDSHFWAELDALYKPFQEGCVLFEFPVDYQDQQNVTGFISYVRNMDPATFIFYFIGRVVTIHDLERTQLDPKFIIEQLNRYCETAGHPLYGYVDALELMLADVPAYQARLIALWEQYWTKFFQGQAALLLDHWSNAIAEKQQILARSGGHVLLELVTRKKHLPDNLPGEQPIREIVYVPVYFATALSYVFFGYGNVTILFDSEATLARLSEIEERKEAAVSVSRALSDNTRLNILKLIVHRDGAMHGKIIAEKLDLSPSSVSRQLAQLRDSGLLIEERHDNQTVTYRLVKDAITSLPDKIFDYLYS